jgi:hypothetical protein
LVGTWGGRYVTKTSTKKVAESSQWKNFRVTGLSPDAGLQGDLLFYPQRPFPVSGLIFAASPECDNHVTKQTLMGGWNSELVFRCAVCHPQN